MEEDLKSHLKESYKTVHDVMPHVKAGYPYYVESISTYTPTAGGGSVWYDVTVSGAPDNADILVDLTIYAEQAAASDWLYFRTRKKGSSQAYEGCIAGAGGGVGSSGYPDLAGTIRQLLSSDKKYQYSHDRSGWNVVTVKQIGYWVIPT